MKRILLILVTFSLLSAGGAAQDLPSYFGSYDPHVGGFDLPIYDMKVLPVYQEAWDLREKRIRVSQWQAGTYTILYLRAGIPISRGRAVIIK
jgi:hypothetical protein